MCQFVISYSLIKRDNYDLFCDQFRRIREGLRSLFKFGRQFDFIFEQLLSRNRIDGFPSLSDMLHEPLIAATKN